MSVAMLSVSDEVETIRKAVHGVARLLRESKDSSPNDAVDGDTVDAGVAMLDIVEARLRLLSGAMRGMVDPVLCVEAFNRVEGARIKLDRPDVRLSAARRR